MAVIEDKFIDSSVYFIPVWFDDLTAFSAALDKDGRWNLLAPDETRTNYLLKYANSISTNPKLYQCRRLKDPAALKLYMLEGYRTMETLDPQAELTEVRFSCFGTGAGFLEFWVKYGTRDVDKIIEFAGWFRKAYISEKHIAALGLDKLSLQQAALSLLPAGSGAELFFCSPSEAVFKREALCYHMLHRHYGERQPEAMQRQLFQLRRGYRTDFEYEINADRSDYDFTYSPYSYDHWSGSQEGLINLNYERSDDPGDKRNYFLRSHKYSQLCNDYRFSYLLLLNQRFTGIWLIQEVSAAGENSARLKELNHRVIRLNTIYSFRVISNDQLYQNVYSRMYRIFDIDSLLEDIRDNEAQMLQLQRDTEEKSESFTNTLLLALSLLAVFSALIDAADYFGMFAFFVSWSKWFSAALVLLIFAAAIVKWLLKQHKQ